MIVRQLRILDQMVMICGVVSEDFAGLIFKASILNGIRPETVLMMWIIPFQMRRNCFDGDLPEVASC